MNRRVFISGIAAGILSPLLSSLPADTDPVVREAVGKLSPQFRLWRHIERTLKQSLELHMFQVNDTTTRKSVIQTVDKSLKRVQEEFPQLDWKTRCDITNNKDPENLTVSLKYRDANTEYHKVIATTNELHPALKKTLDK